MIGKPCKCKFLFNLFLKYFHLFIEQQHWQEEFPECGGRQQSPVNIDTRLAAYSQNIQGNKIQFTGYSHPLEDFTIRNNGHTIAFSYRDNFYRIRKPSERPGITGSALKWNAFVLSGFHFHWGQRSGYGSEHTFNGLPYDMEVINLVVFKCVQKFTIFNLRFTLFTTTPTSTRLLMRPLPTTMAAV